MHSAAMALGRPSAPEEQEPAARASASPIDRPPSPPAPASPAPVVDEPSVDSGPPLSSRALLRGAPWVATTYFAQGLPYSLVHTVAAQLFTAMGSSPEVIGLTSLFNLPWNAKFVVAPIVDHVGTLRKWLVGAEIALALLVLAIAVPADSAPARTLMIGFAAVAIVAATHDVAIDGFYLRALDTKRQAALSGLRVPAYRLALFAGNGSLVVLAGATSWRLALLVAAFSLGGIALWHALALPRPASEHEAAGLPPPTARARLASIRAAYTSFFTAPRAAAVIAFLVLFRLGDALMFAMNQPFLKSLELDTTARGVVAGTLGTAAGIAGSLFGSAVVAKRGLARTLVPIAIAQSLAILLYVALALWRPGIAWTAVIVAAEQLVAGFGTAAFLVFIMRRSAGEHRASHFAFSTAIMSLGSTAAGSASGYLQQAVGFPTFFLIAFAASIPGVLLAFVVPKQPLAES